jgi:hypothetical protein
MISDCDILLKTWENYLERYNDRYLLEKDEIGILCIILKDNLGCIQPYSVIDKQLVAVINFDSQQKKFLFKKMLIEYEGVMLDITQEGQDELCVMFYEEDLKELESLFKISKQN